MTYLALKIKTKFESYLVSTIDWNGEIFHFQVQKNRKKINLLRQLWIWNSVYFRASKTDKEKRWNYPGKNVGLTADFLHKAPDFWLVLNSWEIFLRHGGGGLAIPLRPTNKGARGQRARGPPHCHGFFIFSSHHGLVGPKNSGPILFVQGISNFFSGLRSDLKKLGGG